MNNDILMMLGELIIEKARDDSISCLLGEIKGNINSYQGIQMRKLLVDFDEEQLAIIAELIPTIVDTSLHYFLDMIDSSEELKLLFLDEKSNYIDIKELSDGLAGELYSDEGWIAKFSKQPLGLE